MSKEKDVDKLKDLKNQVNKLTKKLDELGRVYVGSGVYSGRQDFDIIISIVKCISEAIDILEKRIEALEKANK